MLAKRQTSAPSRISVRYYLWSPDGPWRIPNRVHHDLVNGKLAIPQYASTKQKVLEVFARRISARTYSLRGRGSIFSFDEKGYLERERAEEIMGFIVEQARRPSTHRNMILNDGLGLIVVFAHFSKEGRGFCVVMPYLHRSKKR